MFFQVSSVNLNNGDDCGNKFRSNKNLGLLFFLAIVIGTKIKDPLYEEIRRQKKLQSAQAPS